MYCAGVYPEWLNYATPIIDYRLYNHFKNSFSPLSIPPQGMGAMGEMKKAILDSTNEMWFNDRYCNCDERCNISEEEAAGWKEKYDIKLTEYEGYGDKTKIKYFIIGGLLLASAGVGFYFSNKKFSKRSK